ncbi:MAG: glycoside hydrolase [Tenericutes bacterium HGW-Tenericutes-6]|nr:MAG: glycoside hydrolase [Tenericutes bacterium HGW-Tenericutes-6]PKK96672.1 MAG: glycoside hydrolase [Tenericutes bacterium HGW-Tenericutes-3]
MSYKLLWEDKFEIDGAPNPKIWNMETGGHGFGNGEQQYYTNELKNIFVKDGILNIVAYHEPYENCNYTSGKITTENKVSIQKGRIEVIAKVPSGHGTWPAIWFLGNKFRKISWPECGEIDLMEHVGHNENVVHFSLHSKTNYFHINNQPTKVVKKENIVNEFHEYAMDWKEDEIIFYLDGIEQERFLKRKGAKSDEWPFNQDFYMIINLALGGTWGGAIDDSSFPITFQVKSVKVYKESK